MASVIEAFQENYQSQARPPLRLKPGKGWQGPWQTYREMQSLILFFVYNDNNLNREGALAPGFSRFAGRI
jgi:hypothetical protein